MLKTATGPTSLSYLTVPKAKNLWNSDLASKVNAFIERCVFDFIAFVLGIIDSIDLIIVNLGVYSPHTVDLNIIVTSVSVSNPSAQGAVL